MSFALLQSRRGCSINSPKVKQEVGVSGVSCSGTIDEEVSSDGGASLCDSCDGYLGELPDKSSLPMLCDQCLSQLATPFLAVEFRMTSENLTKTETLHDDVSQTATGETSRVKYKPPNSKISQQGVPVVHADSGKRMLRVEQHCWASHICNSRDQLNSGFGCLKLMNANYYEKSYSSRRKKSVRFNVEEKGVGSKEEEDEEEASSDGCEHENGTPTGSN